MVSRTFSTLFVINKKDFLEEIQKNPIDYVN